MKTLYGTCPNEHLLWRCSSDCTSLQIYHWDGEMPAEDKLPDVWRSLYESGFDETCTIPVGDLRSALNALKVRDVSFWAKQVNESDIVEDTVAGSAVFSFREFLVKLGNGARVASYVMPNGRKAVWLTGIPPTMKVRDFLSSAVPLIWERAKKGLTPMQKCDVAIETLQKLIRIYGPDPVFSKGLAALGRARQDIFKALNEDHKPNGEGDADILDQEYIDELYARASDALFRDPRESDMKKKFCNVIHKESSDSAFKVTVKKDDLDALVDSYNYLQNAEITRHNDPVNHPSHYQLHGGMEVIDIIEAVTWDLPSDEAYAIGNAIKYICRYRNKGKPIQDLEKAKWYLNRAIEDYKKRGDGD